MALLKFPFEESHSPIFGKVHRPVAMFQLWSWTLKQWVNIVGIVDTGADYTLLPRFYADKLGIDMQRHGQRHMTGGVGGVEAVFVCKRVRAQLGAWRGMIPVGFLSHDDIPPLLGRQGFLERLRLSFYRHQTHIGI